uniref:Translocator protein n=2 Tax=Sander lucioperca TaxID=283035 RepID=A0A8C9ZFR3_SANLU
MWLPMLGMTALPHLGGLIGGYITRKQVKTWYTTLKKPSWRPPNAAFPIVWTCLYTGMGYGSYLVWKELGGFTEDALVPLGLYGLQLALNWTWTPIFFGAHKLKLALMEIVLLTSTVAATMVSWYPVSRTATLLMAPYLSWLCLATSLNYCIWRDNSEEKEELKLLSAGETSPNPVLSWPRPGAIPHTALGTDGTWWQTSLDNGHVLILLLWVLTAACILNAAVLPSSGVG